MKKKELKAKVLKLEKRLTEYDSIFGHELDERLSNRESHLERIRLLHTPDSQLSKEEQERKSIFEHFEQERERLTSMEQRILNPIVEWP